MSSNEEETTIDFGEIKDGQLQIVEVAQFDPDAAEGEDTNEDNTHLQYMQVMEPTGREVLQLNLLNFTLVKCGEDGEESYKLVANTEASNASVQELSDLNNISNVTCVLQSSDNEEQESNSSQFVMLQGDEAEQEQDSYVMVEGSVGPIVFLESELKKINRKKTSQLDKMTQKPIPTALELLEKAKAVNKARKILRSIARGRRGGGPEVEPRTMLASPEFKLYLYSCRMCEFKCNATRELTEHKKTAHGDSKRAYNRAFPGRQFKAQRSAQCAHCPYRATEQNALEVHVKIHHSGTLDGVDDSSTSDMKLGL